MFLLVGFLLGERSEESALEPELRGNTLRVYWYMLQQGEPVGVREVQRAISMSSPSVASHHLNKLEGLGLIGKRTDNHYELKRLVKVGVLQSFVAFRGRLLPRYVFVAIFFTAFTTAYLTLTIVVPIGIFDRYVAIAVGLIGAFFGWFETHRLWKLKLT